MQVAENSYEFAAKCLVRRGFGAELAPHNPSLQLFPVFGGGPAIVLLPFSFFRAVPITFVASAQALFLLCDPARIGCDAGVRNLRQRGVLALGAGIDAEAGSDRLRGNADIELAGFAFAAERSAEFDVHADAIGRFVFGKADVAVDARQICASPAAGLKLRIQLQHSGGKLLAQCAQRLYYTLLVAVAVGVHPFGTIVAG